MLKILLILGITAYILYKVGSFLFKIGAASQQFRDNQAGNIHGSRPDAKSKKKTVEETHNRATFLFRKDLQDRLDNLADGKRGFKTMFLNQAVEALLDEMEDEQSFK